MPYITKERVSEIRTELKKEFPNFKFSITRRDSVEVKVVILSAPFNMLTCGENYECVNHFYIAEHYKETPAIMDVLLKINSIMDAGNRTITTDGDYGNIPAFYTDLSIGNWEKPFIVK